MSEPAASRPDRAPPSSGQLWGLWLGWAWVIAIVLAALAAVLHLDALAGALDLQSLLG
jgi:hypothetical protein